jgi:hypothetical protein
MYKFHPFRFLFAYAFSRVFYLQANLRENCLCGFSD